MATVPLSGTNIRLMSGVPFNNDYKNTRWFDTVSQQTSYFLSKPVTYTENDHTFQRIEGRHFVKVNKSIDELWGTNYMMFQNSNYNTKWFYGFVTKLEYVQRNMTYVHFQIDVFQTWKFEMNFKPSYVVREHCPLWELDGSPVVNTIDEGLDYGQHYETVQVTNYRPSEDIMFLVIVAKENMHQPAGLQIVPNYNGMPQPLTYYIVPFRLVGNEPIVMMDGEPIGDLSDVLLTLKVLSSSEVAVNNIASLYVTDYVGKDLAVGGGTVSFDSESFEVAHISDNKNGNIRVMWVKNINEYESKFTNLGNKYDGFESVKESKLMMYPYCVTVLDDFKGNRITVKNEHIKDRDLNIRVMGSLGTSHKTSYSVDNYLIDNGLMYDDMVSMALENAIISNNPNDISVISDYLSAYLQGNRNTIENQKSAIMWNGTIGALTGGAVGGAQSTWVSKGGMMANPIGVGAAGLQTVTGVGNAIIEMQGIQAKQKDIDNTPAQMVKMGGNTAFDFGNSLTGIYIVKKQLTREYREKLEDFFNMFGYKVDRVKIPNFKTRRYWNYVQTLNCNIIGNMNNDDLTELKRVFDNGITFWHTEDVGNYALENEVI